HLKITIEEGNSDDFTYITYKNKKYPVEIISKNQNFYEVLINNVSYTFSVETPISYKRKRFLKKNLGESKLESLLAPMPGKIVDILVEDDATIKEGDPLLVLEAMKMQNEISSHISGKIKSINVKPGDTVNKDDILVEIEK
ncbi:MAG: acetyl-CoA carboxylase biotin carboxyl carrier protein subunit, partial [bacterium]